MRQPKVFNATKLDPAVERSQTRWFEKENLPDQLGDGSWLPPSSGKRTGTETGFVPTSSDKCTKKTPAMCIYHTAREICTTKETREQENIIQ